MNILHIRQERRSDDRYGIRLTLKRADHPDQEAETAIQFALSGQEKEDIRWYLEDYLQRAASVERIIVDHVEQLIRYRGTELYTKVLAVDRRTQAIWYSIRNELADLRVEIATGIAEATSIPWELMSDPEMDFPISLRVKSFVRLHSNPNISFVPIPSAQDGRIRLLYIASRPAGPADVELRAVANSLLKGLGPNRGRFDIKGLRPPTFEQLQKELKTAKAQGKPYHIVHFDGHGVYADLRKTLPSDWSISLSNVTFGGDAAGPHGYLFFEHFGSDGMRPVSGEDLGRLLHDTGVPMLVLNACQSAMNLGDSRPHEVNGVHEEIRAFGSLAQAVADQGVPAVLGMRYNLYVVTAAQFIGQLYLEIASGRGFGDAVTEGRKHLQLNPDRWLGLESRPLQDWFVPVAYEAARIVLFPGDQTVVHAEYMDLDPIFQNRTLLRYVPEDEFIGRDETLLALDRAFDSRRVVLLHAYAGQGKSATSVEFARWYSITGGLGDRPVVLLSSFANYVSLDNLMDLVGRTFTEELAAQGIDWSAINNRERRRAHVIKILRRFSVLWIWDNVEAIVGFPEGAESQWTMSDQNDLREFLQQVALDSVIQCKILLTSRREERNWLGEIPFRISMPRMRNSDTARLALRLGAERGLSIAEIAEWQTLLEYCAGNPLTLRVLVGQAVRTGLRGRAAINSFVEAIRRGEQPIEDVDETQGRDGSLGASLDYGFHNAFSKKDLSVISLLHFFQGTVDVDVIALMGLGDEFVLPELQRVSKEYIAEIIVRAKEVGLLTHIYAELYVIHPALPLYLRRIFDEYYDGNESRSTKELALRSWVSAVSAWGAHYQRLVVDGNLNVINLLRLEEANLVSAWRIALDRNWLGDVTSCTIALRTLFDHEGRIGELIALIEKVWPHFCAPDGSPLAGSKRDYRIIIGHRTFLAQHYEHDIEKAIKLQSRLVDRVRIETSEIWRLPFNVALTDGQRQELRDLAVAVATLGQLFREEGRIAEAINFYGDSLELYKRIADRQGQAITEGNIGNANLALEPSDYGAAEAAFRRSLALRDSCDVMGRSKSLAGIAMANFEGMLSAVKRGAPEGEVMSYANQAQTHYLAALDECPDAAVTDIARLHMNLGVFYFWAGNQSAARDHYEMAVERFEKAGNRFDAGRTRARIASNYFKVSLESENANLRRNNLQSARAYAEAALLDFQHFGGRAVEEEAEMRHVLDEIDDALSSE